MTIAATMPALALTAPTPGPFRRTHLPALDGLRGIAILLVLGHHLLSLFTMQSGLLLPLLMRLRAGWFGVDLFLVLSGYLITGILFDAKGRPHFIRNFYARRVLRIFPLYFGVLILIATLSHWIIRPEDGALREGFPSLWIFSSNYWQARMGFIEGTYVGFSHFWSLAVEEHFYLVWPWIILFVPRQRLIAVCLILLGIVTIWRAGFAAAFPLRPGELYMWTQFRADALLFGGLVALLERAPPGLMPLRRIAGVLAGAGTLVLAMELLVFGGIPRPFTATSSLLYSGLALCFASILIIIRTGGGWGTSLFKNKILRILGKYSYGIYVFHWLIKASMAQLAALPWMIEKFGLCGAQAAALLLWIATTALCVVISWHCVECPMLRLKKHFEPQPATA